MGLIRSAGRASAGSSSGIATPEKWVEDWFSGGLTNSSGVRVDYDTALMYSPFFAGVRVISEDVGSLPLHLYERLRPRGKRRADHPLAELLRYEPNPMMSAQQFRETLQGHALMWGNGVAQVVTHPRTGVIEELWPLRPDRLCIKVVRTGPGRLTRIYRYDDDVNGIHATLMPDEVLHIAGLGYDGVRGYPVVEHAANSIGLGLATEHHGSKVFSNGSAPGGALTHPGVLSPEARNRMAADWENIHRSIDNAHRVAILEEGVTWQAVGMPNDSAQFLETRKLQVTEMARWLRLPSHKISDLERATFSNIEQQQLDYVSSALRTWLERWEQAVYTQLLTKEEKGRYYAEHLVDALLRGDTVSRYQAYAVGRQWGWLSANDIREKENENPVPGGDDYLVPLNMVSAGGGSDGGAGRSAARRGGGSRRAADGEDDDWFAQIVAVDAEIAALEAEKVGELVSEHLQPGRARSIPAFLAALSALYGEAGPVAAAMHALWSPVMQAMGQAVAREAADEVGHEDDVDLSTWVQAYTNSHIGYRLAASFGQLRKLVGGSASQEDAAEAIADRLLEWSRDRPERTARWETNQLTNAAKRKVWEDVGIDGVRWETQGKNCPYCQRLDGKVVGLKDAFIAKGDEVPGENEGEQLVAKRNTFNPPAHVGCDCRLAPVVAD